MRKEQKVIDGLGPIGIIIEALKLFLTHSKFFMLVQLTLILPVVTLSIITDYFIRQDEHNRFRPPRGTSCLSHLLSNFRISFQWGDSGLQLGLVASLVVLLGMLLSAVFAILMQVASSLSSAAILYAVGLHYTGQSVSFEDVRCAVIPRLWMRKTVTAMYDLSLAYPILMLQAWGSLLLIQNRADLPLMLSGVAALGALGFGAVICLAMVFRLAICVSVLEKDYGWAAVRRTPKLLKGRITVAVSFELLWRVLSIISIFVFERAFGHEMTGNDPLKIILLIIDLAPMICWTSFLWQMGSLCAGVQYASFKAYHGEDLAESVYEKPTQLMTPKSMQTRQTLLCR